MGVWEKINGLLGTVVGGVNLVGIQHHLIFVQKEMKENYFLAKRL